MELKSTNLLSPCFVIILFVEAILSNEVVNKINRNGRFVTQVNATDMSTLILGVGTGTHRMKPNQVIRIHSEHYGISNYYHQESSWWSFKGDGCGVSVVCPCFDVPSSFQCFGDFLKIADLPFYHQRFCGTVKPQGIYRSSGDLTLRFRVDKRETGKGFLCYVSCTEVGKADPGIPVIAEADCFKALPPITTAKVEQVESVQTIDNGAEQSKSGNGTKCLNGEIEVGNECYVPKKKGESLLEKVTGALAAVGLSKSKLIESNLKPIGERG